MKAKVTLSKSPLGRTLTGLLTDLVTGGPISSSAVEIQRLVRGRFVTLGSVITDSEGRFACELIAPERGSYQLKAVFEGSPIYEPAESSVVTLEVAKLASYMHIVAWSAPTKAPDETIVRGDEVTLFDGMLTDGPDWMTSNPIAWAEVWLTVYNPDGTVFWEGWELTSEYGVWSFTSVPMPTVAGTCTCTARFYGDDTYEASEVSWTIITEERVPILALGIVPTTLFPGETFTWSGNLYDPKVTEYGLASRTIYLQQSLDGVTWVDVDSVVTGADGAYSKTFAAPTTTGTYYYRTRFAGGSPGGTFKTAFSPRIAVAVQSVAKPVVSKKRYDFSR